MKALGAALFGLTASTFAAYPSSAQSDAGFPPVPRPTIEVPDYSFEHEEREIASWRIDGPRASRDRFAYLIFDPAQDGLQRRALILVDRVNGEKAFFLQGKELLPVPAVKGKPLQERIDRSLTDRTLLVTPDWTSPDRTITINIERDSALKEPVIIGFTWALNNFRDKFEDVPCLALPDVVTLTRSEITLQFVILLKREKTEVNLVRPGCSDFTPPLSSPMFSYIEAGRLHFAFTKKRFVIQYRNYIVSIPFDLDDEMIRRSPLLVTKGQLDKILNDVRNSDDPNTRMETSEARTKSDAAVQRSIDVALIALLKAKGEKR